MSVSAHARALVRRRTSLASLIDREVCTEHAAHVRFLARGTFDVARARAYADELIALEDEHAVFTRWTVSKGKGPDNREPGAFEGPRCELCDRRRVESSAESKRTHPFACHYEDCAAAPSERYDRPGGWPGKLAREWGTVPCGACNGERGARVPDCESQYTVGADPHESPGCHELQEGWHQGECFDQWVWCKPCKGTGRQPKPGADRRASQGRSLARVGRRLRDMLDGKGDYKHAAKQPAECERSRCVRGRCTYTPRDDMSATYDYECPDCHGTGHNLAGYLPEVEVTPAMMAALADVAALDWVGQLPAWCVGLGVTVADIDAWVAARRDPENPEQLVTRVVPRGEHHKGRHLRTMIAVRDELAWVKATSLPGLGGQHDAHVLACQRQRFPRWRRGELLHAQQRRERAEYALEFVAPEASA